MNHDEIWKPVKGYEGLYEINTNGIIRSIERIIHFKDRKRIVRACVRKQNINVRGYYYVRLSKNGKGKNVLVHRALMEAFVPNPDNKPYIDHINTIKTDNRLENLKWVTSKENTRNPLTIEHIINACANDNCKEKQRETKGRIRAKNYNPKQIFQYSLDGKFIAEYPSQSAAIRELGHGHRNAVGNIKVALDNNRKSAYGYMWATSKHEIEPYIKPRGKCVQIAQIDNSGNVIKAWDSVKEAAKSIGIYDTNLSKIIKNAGGHYKGMTFRYVD